MMKTKLSFIARLTVMMGVFLTLTGGLTHTVQAETCTWLGNNNTWSNTSNWSCGHVPTSADDVVIADQANDPIITQTPKTINVNTLTINSGASLINDSASLQIYATNVVNNGTIKTQGMDSASIRVYSLLDNNHQIHANAGIINLEYGGTHSGSFFGPGGIIFTGSSHSFTSTSTISAKNVAFMFSGELNYAGQFNQQLDGSHVNIDDAHVTISNLTNYHVGTVNILNTGSWTVGLSGSITGSVSVPANTSFVGTGTVGGDLTNAGTVSPGASPGRIAVSGNYTQESTGVLAMEIGGKIPGHNLDELVVTGTATLDGTLQVSLIDGFTPELGDSFSLMWYASHTGTFATVNLPALNPGLEWEMTLGASDLTLTVTGPCNWLGGSEWFESNNWSCGHIPGVSDDVVIPDTTADPWINTNDKSISVKSLTIQAGATLRVSECKVTIYLSERLTNQGTLALEDPYDRDNGEIEVRAPVDNDGTIIAEGGTITLRHGGNHTGAFEGDHGEIELLNLNSALPHTFTADSTISVDEVYLSMWDEAVTFPGTFNRPTAQGGTDLTIAKESLTITNPSDNLGTVWLVSSELKYAGTITENLTNWGTVSPGASPGRITVQGNYKQVDDSNYDGTLNVELGGTTPGTQYDQILVSGSATLDGALQVNLIDGFTPTLGDRFALIVYSSHNGAFTTETLPALDPGLEWEVSYGSTTLTLDVINSGGTIEGTVSYTGAEVGEDVNIGYFTDPNGPPDYSINVPYTDGTYPYTFSGLEDGTYAICALMDLNDSGDPDPGEPYNCYDDDADGDPDPIVISGASSHTDIDFELKDFVKIYLPLIVR